MKKDKALMPGTFDPFTNGHFEVLQKTLNSFKEVHVVIMENENKKPYFNLNKRLDIIKGLNISNVVVAYWDGLAMDYAKKHNIKTVVRGIRANTDIAYETYIAQQYKAKNSSIKILMLKTQTNISSTQVKKMLKVGQDVSHLVPWRE